MCHLGACIAFFLRFMKCEKRGRISTYMYCTCMYGTAKKKRPGYLVGNLVATNWPIEKALHAIGYNQIPTK